MLPGGTLLISTLNLVQSMQHAYINNLKFKELLYDTMIILTNCYKIFMLINRSSDTFLIAIHNSSGLNKLFEKNKERLKLNNEESIKNFENEFEIMFNDELKIANDNKIINRNNIMSQKNV